MKKLLRFISVLTFVLLLGLGMVVNNNKADAETKKNVTIHVKDMAGWGSVNIYTYDGDGEIAGKWPGQAMKANNGWFDYTFSTSKELNLVFNHKVSEEKFVQTNDLKKVSAEKSEYWVTIAKGSDVKSGMGDKVGFLATLYEKDPTVTQATATPTPTANVQPSATPTAQPTATPTTVPEKKEAVTTPTPVTKDTSVKKETKVNKKKVTKPGQVKKVKVTRKGKKNIVIKFTKVKGAKGYQVYLKVSKKGSYKLVRTIKNGKTVTCKIKASCDKKVYVRVRAYKNNGKKLVLGKFSTTKTLK